MQLKELQASKSTNPQDANELLYQVPCQTSKLSNSDLKIDVNSDAKSNGIGGFSYVAVNGSR